MNDLKTPKLIYLKGFLFLLILAICGSLIIAECPTWKVGFLLILVIWSSARLYYFMFYVIEKYVDDDFKFSGIGSFLRYLIAKLLKK